MPRNTSKFDLRSSEDLVVDTPERNQYQSPEHGPPNDINSAVKNREEMNKMLRTSQDNQNVVLISKEQHSYKVLLKAIEPTEGETSPRKDIQLRPSNIYTDSSETQLLEEESNENQNRSEVRGSLLGLQDSSGFIDLPE